MFPLSRANESHIKWTDFNTNDFTRCPERFLQLLNSRATYHPRGFARRDSFKVNLDMAIDIGIMNDKKVKYVPGITAVAMSDVTVEEDDTYGSIYFPGDQEEYNSMMCTHSRPSNAEMIMNIQDRIYRFRKQFLDTISTSLVQKI